MSQMWIRIHLCQNSWIWIRIRLRWCGSSPLVTCKALCESRILLYTIRMLLTLPRAFWPSFSGYQKFQKFINNLHVVNDLSERAVKLIQDNVSKAKSEERLQNLLQAQMSWMKPAAREKNHIWKLEVPLHPYALPHHINSWSTCSFNSQNEVFFCTYLLNWQFCLKYVQFSQWSFFMLNSQLK